MKRARNCSFNSGSRLSNAIPETGTSGQESRRWEETSVLWEECAAHRGCNRDENAIDQDGDGCRKNRVSGEERGWFELVESDWCECHSCQ